MFTILTSYPQLEKQMSAFHGCMTGRSKEQSQE